MRAERAAITERGDMPGEPPIALYRAVFCEDK